MDVSLIIRMSMSSNRDLILTGQIETGSMTLKHLKTNIVVIDFHIGNIPSRNKFYSILFYHQGGLLIGGVS